MDKFWILKKLIFICLSAIYLMTAIYAEIQDLLNHQNNLLYFKKKLFTGLLKKEEDSVLVEKSYLNGIPHGIQKTYYRSGQLKKVAMFTNGKENGRMIQYFESGAKQMNANYYQGELDGIFEEWDTEGILITRKTYYKGKLIAIKS